MSKSNTTPMLDPFDVMSVQRSLRHTFTREQLDEARHNDGNLSCVIRYQIHHIYFKTLVFPDDLLTTEQEAKIERSVFDER